LVRTVVTSPFPALPRVDREDAHLILAKPRGVKRLDQPCCPFLTNSAGRLPSSLKKILRNFGYGRRLRIYEDKCVVLDEPTYRPKGFAPAVGLAKTIHRPCAYGLGNYLGNSFQFLNWV